MSKPTGKAIKEAVWYWRTVLGLSDWQLIVLIQRMPEGEWGSAEVQVEYKRATLRFSPSAMAKHGDTVDNCVVHELGHLMAEPLAEYTLSLTKTAPQKERTRQLEESLVTDLTNLVLRLHRRPRP